MTGMNGADPAGLAAVIAPGWLLLPAIGAAGCLLLAGFGARLVRVPAFEVTGPDRATEESAGESVLDRALELIGRRAGRLAGVGDHGLVAQRIDAAGGPAGLTVERFLARRAGGVILALVAVVLYASSGSPIIGFGVAAGVAVLPDYRLRAAGRRRQNEIERVLPDFLDVLGITILAGASFRVGLVRVAEALPSALAEEFTTVTRQMQVGVTRRRAFEDLRDRNPSPGLRRLVAGVLQAEELGHSLADMLTGLSAEIRSTGAQDARRRADSTDKTISLITAVVLLPAMVLLVLAVFFGSIGGA